MVLDIQDNPIFLDQTGLAVLRFNQDKTWQLVWNDSGLLKKAQDTRIYWMDNKIVVSYNDDNKEGFPISYQILTIVNDDGVSPDIHLSPSRNMLEHYPTHKIEKNATLIVEDVVQYEFSGGKYIVLYRDQKISSAVFHFQHIYKLYGSKIIFSMSSPSIAYGQDTFLAVGHTKIDYRYSYPEYPELDEFVKSCPHDHYHDRYIYLMFLYEFNHDFEVTRLSFNFIPSISKEEDNYLVFPCGLFEYKNRFYITYGENDVKTRMISFEREEVEAVLNNNQLNSEEPVCAFLEKEVTDFTSIIPSFTEENSFIFNNSMIHWKDDLFLCTYRLVYMNSHKSFQNPLQVWYEMWNSDDDDDEDYDKDPLLRRTSNASVASLQ